LELDGDSQLELDKDGGDGGGVEPQVMGGLPDGLESRP
jgi:hypothetical protein